MKKILCLILMITMSLSVFETVSFAFDEAIQLASVEDNEAYIYNFLRETMGFNVAATCGILANLSCENTSFEPSRRQGGGVGYGSYNDSVGYGICQWTYWSRKLELQTWCNANIGDGSWATLYGQLRFMQYEIEKDNIFYLLKNVSDTTDGAYQAGYHFCMDYERPACKDLPYKGFPTESDYRATRAQNSFWPKYSSSYVENLYITNPIDGDQQITTNYTYIQWNNISGAADYVLTIKNMDDGSYLKVNNGTPNGIVLNNYHVGNVTEFGINSMKPSTNYKVYITALDTNGNFFKNCQGGVTYSGGGIGFKTVNAPNLIYPTDQQSDVASGNQVIYWEEVPATVYYTVVLRNLKTNTLIHNTDIKLYSNSVNVKLDDNTEYRVFITAYNNTTYDFMRTSSISTFKTSSTTMTTYFDAKGGTCIPASKTVSCNTTYGSLPVPTMDRYIFEGWYKEESYVNKVTENTIVTDTANHTLYAKWTEDLSKYDVLIENINIDNANGKITFKIVNNNDSIITKGRVYIADMDDAKLSRIFSINFSNLGAEEYINKTVYFDKSKAISNINLYIWNPDKMQPFSKKYVVIDK